MREFNMQPMQVRVTDFVQWQRSGALDLSPRFQRRSVWKPQNRAFFLDTIIRGLPVPLLFIREVTNLDTQSVTRAVVDGQQRLRSLFAFIDPQLLDDYDPERDFFRLPKTLGPDLRGRSYSELDNRYKTRILEDTFAVDIVPTLAEDRDVLEIFARLNSTGLRLNAQELRNAEFSGPFRDAMYSIGYEQLERWQDWGIFTDDQIARMLEVQLVSDLVLNMLEGLTGRSQARLDKLYRKYDVEFPNSRQVIRRFGAVMDAIDNLIGGTLRGTVFRSEIHFFSLFTYLYDQIWGLGSDIDATKARALSTDLRNSLLAVSASFKAGRAPANVQDAVKRASTDYGRRKIRFDYMVAACGN